MADPFAELAKLIGNLEQLGSGTEPIEKAVAVAVQSELEEQYTEGVGPDGDTWAVKADGSSSHLQDTRGMRRSTKAVRGVGGVNVTIPKPGGFHQSGTKKMPARPLVPEGDALPPRWDEAVSGAARSVVLKTLGK